LLVCFLDRPCACAWYMHELALIHLMSLRSCFCHCDSSGSPAKKTSPPDGPLPCNLRSVNEPQVALLASTPWPGWGRKHRLPLPDLTPASRQGLSCACTLTQTANRFAEQSFPRLSRHSAPSRQPSKDRVDWFVRRANLLIRRPHGAIQGGGYRSRTDDPLRARQVL
jgi:hypothetical protein